MANYVIRNKRGDAVVREDEIYDWFVNKDNAALCDYANKPFEFVRKVIRNVEQYLALATALATMASQASRWIVSSGCWQRVQPALRAAPCRRHFAKGAV